MRECEVCGRLMRFGLWEVLTAEQSVAYGELKKCDGVEIRKEICDRCN